MTYPAPSGVLRSTSGLFSMKEIWPYWSESIPGPQRWLRSISYIKRGCKPGAVQSGEGKAMGRCYQSVQHLRDAMHSREPNFFSAAPTGKIRGNVKYLTTWNTIWTWENYFLLWGCLNTGTSCPERLWRPHSWIQ